MFWQYIIMIKQNLKNIQGAKNKEKTLTHMLKRLARRISSDNRRHYESKKLDNEY